MKVMHVITGLKTGGAEKQLPLLTSHSRAEPSVIALTDAHEVAAALRSKGVPVFDIGMRSNRDLDAVRRLARLMARERPDVVHLHLYRAIVYGRVAAAIARVPAVVTTEHSLTDGQLEGRRTTAAVRGLYLSTEPLSHATIAVSEEVSTRLVQWGVSAHKVHVVPNGVDFATLKTTRALRAEGRRDLDLPLSAEVIGGVGRLYRTKRWDLLIRAVSPVLGPHRRLLLVGAGQEESALRQLVDSLGVSSWVHMPGTREDLSPILAAMDVVVSPSPHETFGLALVEAAAAGRPVVYVHCPALDEFGPLEGVVRVPADETHLRNATLSALRETWPTTPASTFARYDISQVSQQVDAVYEESLRLTRRSIRRAS